MTKRKFIREQVDDVSTWEFEGTLSSVLKRVQELIDKHGPGAYLNYNRHFYYDYDNNPTPRYEMYIDREETDAEVKQRLMVEANYARQREEADKAEFERLSKKFGEQK
jgi:hypothetical protein